jgi:hypothetical protein
MAEGLTGIVPPFATTAATFMHIPSATIGTPMIRRFTNAATIRHPYEVNQRTEATPASIRHGRNANGNATT